MTPVLLQKLLLSYLGPVHHRLRTQTKDYGVRSTEDEDLNMVMVALMEVKVMAVKVVLGRW